MIWKRRQKGTDTDEQWQQAWQKPEQLASEKKQAMLQAVYERVDNAAYYRRRVLYISTGAVAAVLVSFVIRFTLQRKELVPVTEWNTIASNGEKKMVQLADGSVIWLAPHSAVQVYPAFSKQRSIILNKGTAFFNVAQDKVHPFSVAVNAHQVKVLGTAFTIDRKDTVDLDLTVKEGSVALNGKQVQIVLHGGEQVSTFNARASQVQKTPDISADWWLQQEARLLDVSVKELLVRVESYYHVKLHAGKMKEDTKVTLTWDFTQSMEKNLAVLNLLTGSNIQ